MMKQKGEHIGFIEAIRAIAALMVLLFHFISYHNGNSFLIVNENVREWSTFGAQGVEMFYVISGYVMFLSLTRKKYVLQNFGRYLLKRGWRILPLYWLVILLMLGIQLAWQVDLDPKNVVANMTFTVELFDDTFWMNPVFSTLGVEVQFYIVLGLIFPLLQRNRALKFGLFVAWILAGYFTPTHYTFLSAAPFFITGILLFESEQRDRTVNYSFIGLLLVGFLGLQQFQDAAVLVLTVLLLLFVKPTWKPLQRLGEISYSIYLSHGLFGGWLLFFCTWETYGNVKSPWLILLATIFSIAGAFLLYRVIEKRSIDWSKSIQLQAKKETKIT